MSRVKILEFHHDVFIFSNNKQRHYFNPQIHTKLSIEVKIIISIYSSYHEFISVFFYTYKAHLADETHENSQDYFLS